MTTIQRRLLKIIGGLLIALFPIIFFQIKFLVFADRVKLDGRKGEIYGVIFPPSTEYSKDYSDEKFLSIKSGMTEKEVVQILGEPIDRFNRYPAFKDSIFNVGLQYAKGSDLNAHYRLRIIYLRKGIVTERRAHFYYMD